MSLTTAPRPHRVAPSLLAILLVVAAVLGSAAPAAADHDCTVVEVPLSGGGYELVRECAPHEDAGEDAGEGGGGGSGVICERSVLLPGAGHLIDDQGRVTLPVLYVCSDGSDWEQWECIPEFNPDPPGPTCGSGDGDEDPAQAFDGLLQRAVAKVDPPLPGLRHTFDQPADDGTIRAIVQAETWWWAEGALEPVTINDADGPVWVRVIATPGVLEIDPGDSSGTLTCMSQMAYNRNLPYDDQVPGEPKGACVHVYKEVFDEVIATMSVTWTLTYEGFAPGLGAVSGSLGPQTREQTAAFPVKEIQSVIVR
jgi:hypothetical protein